MPAALAPGDKFNIRVLANGTYDVNDVYEKIAGGQTELLGWAADNLNILDYESLNAWLAYYPQASLTGSGRQVISSHIWTQVLGNPNLSLDVKGNLIQGLVANFQLPEQVLNHIVFDILAGHPDHPLYTHIDFLTVMSYLPLQAQISQEALLKMLELTDYPDHSIQAEVVSNLSIPLNLLWDKIDLSYDSVAFAVFSRPDCPAKAALKIFEEPGRPHPSFYPHERFMARVERKLGGQKENLQYLHQMLRSGFNFSEVCRLTVDK